MSEPCGHNSYWTTAYQKCVMCENATLRARIAELEQERDDAEDKREGAYMRMDDLKRQLATVTAERDEAIGSFNDAIGRESVLMNQVADLTKERDQAQAMLARQKEQEAQP